MSAPSNPLEILKPLISSMTKMISPLLSLLMIHTIFGAMFVPLLLALIYFSTPRTRKMPLFWIILFDICLGLVIAILDAYVILNTLFNLQNGVALDLYVIFPIVQFISTWVVDLTLLMRLIAVYPYSSTAASKFFAILAFPAMVKITRIVLIAASEGRYKAFVMSVSSFSVEEKANEELSKSPMIVAEFFCELADHLYVSTIFLYKLHGGFSRAAKSGRVTSGGRDSFANRIRSLFYIALGNFIFPILFNIVLIIIFFSGDPWKFIFVVPSNTYVSILGVVFATIWNQASHHVVDTSSPVHQVKTTGYNANSLAALEFKHDDSTTPRIDTDGPSAGGEGHGQPGGLINPTGNGSSAGMLAFDDFPFSDRSKSESDHSSFGINMDRLGVSVGRDAAGVIHNV